VNSSPIHRTFCGEALAAPLLAAHQSKARERSSMIGDHSNVEQQ
jgi:hypothetical protein